MGGPGCVKITAGAVFIIKRTHLFHSQGISRSDTPFGPERA